MAFAKVGIFKNQVIELIMIQNKVQLFFKYLLILVVTLILCIPLLIFVLYKIETTPVPYMIFYSDIPNIPLTLDVIDHQYFSSLNGDGAIYIEASVSDSDITKIVDNLNENEFTKFDKANSDFKKCTHKNIKSLITEGDAYYSLRHFSGYDCEISVVNKTKNIIAHYKQFD